MSQPQHQEPLPRYFYYAPHEVLLYMEHSAPFTQSSDETVTSALLHDLFAVDSGLQGLLPDNLDDTLPGLSFSWPDTKQDFPFFSLFIVRANDLQAAAYLTYFNEVVNQPIGISFNGINVRLYKAALNWYSGAATHTAIGTSGSGKHARPVINPDVLNHANYIFDERFEGVLQGEKIGCRDRGVDVYLLDTLPPQERIEYAWKRWGDTPNLSRYARILERTGGNSQVYETQQATYLYADADAFDQAKEPQDNPGGNPCDHDYAIHNRHNDPPITAHTVDVAEPPCGDV